ncbi:Pleiotropic drug resistance protein 1 [Sesamum angolense]|uniref:Pleiotropic drug resistance protein 1 n=1 Tax=Sesamum angolense TaxID=2727404 RepID=A0AAE1W8X8_9LAMI|nr:Pleiotropic drug resistance protein 1 [Sesamum angolense]
MMEGGDIFRVSSARLSSSNIWRNTGMEAFSKSSREADDEEALKWAALEKLPTNLQRLLRIAEEGNENFLLKLKERILRVGLDFPTIEVRYEHLNVDAEAYVGSRALPTVFNFTVNILEGFLSYLHVLPSRKKPLPILHDVSGIIKPGRMTLLLGPPCSGKTTLLLALAGKLDPELKVSGRVTYNGHEMKEFVPQRTSAYISQNDLHIGEMTVRETLAFSARCQGVGARYGQNAGRVSRREKEANIKPDPDIDIFMKILGLEVCADTLVGDEMVRGISGGQRKRLTTARALFMDEISTGLDSSTTFQIVNSIRQSIHILQGTAVISLLQPAPETYNLFDDIILLSDGEIVYQGPREHVLEFFEFMGFRCPERKGVADFLQEVTSKKDQEQYRIHKDEPYSYVSSKEFSEAFQSFHVGRKLGDELAVPFDKEKSHPDALTTVKYGVSKKELLKACVAREFLLMKRNSFLILMASISMTVFLRTEMPKKTVTDGGIYMGALFYALIMIMFNGFSELALSILKLPVFYKQRDLLFFPPWAYSLPAWILKIPITLVEVAIWVGLTYYPTGYDSDAGRFFRHFFLLIWVNQMASALFRLMGALGRNMIVANTFGSGSLIAVLVLGGFILTRENIRKWWIWGYWISPMMYGQNAITVNEFLGNSWNHVPPGSNESVGVSVLKSRGIFPHAYWYWIGVGALIGYVLLFNFLCTLALTYLNRPGGGNNIQQSVSARSASSRVDGINEADPNRKKGMVLPFQPLSITFEDIHYAVDMPQEMKARGVQEDRLQLLKGISGAFRPGVLTALMGVTGAGKTTLMDVLAGRKNSGYINGTITISGYPKKQETFARIAGYCEQTDIHSPHVTVHESLQYSAWLRLPREVDAETRKVISNRRYLFFFFGENTYLHLTNKLQMFVEEVMELVELTPLRGGLVGLPGVNGLSTEQRKRLTIAVELVANPSYFHG